MAIYHSRQCVLFAKHFELSRTLLLDTLDATFYNRWCCGNFNGISNLTNNWDKVLKSFQRRQKSRNGNAAEGFGCDIKRSLLSGCLRSGFCSIFEVLFQRTSSGLEVRAAKTLEASVTVFIAFVGMLVGVRCELCLSRS